MSDPAWVDMGQVAFAQPPPGEEGFFSSHAGREVQLQDLFLDMLAEQWVTYSCFWTIYWYIVK